MARRQSRRPREVFAPRDVHPTRACRLVIGRADRNAADAASASPTSYATQIKNVRILLTRDNDAKYTYTVEFKGDSGATLTKNIIMRACLS